MGPIEWCTRRCRNQYLGTGSRGEQRISVSYFEKNPFLAQFHISYSAFFTETTGRGMPSPACPIQSRYFIDICWRSKVREISKKWISGVAAYSLEINQSLLRCQTNTGNDVASGLKWMLASNSVVFMPLPRRETWAMESLLQVYMCQMVRDVVSDTA